ncbi:hypothetical protein [Pendulispora albinea]|uniref:CheW-like domain-containing protein n=1 Tax=Pendulispora albinea TaxID=2741071 RepID=A0ABZ2LQD0_9BACT
MTAFHYVVFRMRGERMAVALGNVRGVAPQTERVSPAGCVVVLQVGGALFDVVADAVEDVIVLSHEDIAAGRELAALAGLDALGAGSALEGFAQVQGELVPIVSAASLATARIGFEPGGLP